MTGILNYPTPGRRPGSSVVESLERRYLFAAFDVMVFSHTAGFRHDSIDEGIAAIRELGAANDFNVVATEDPAAISDANLAQFEAVVFLSTTGDFLGATQQAAFERYIAGGGGFVGVHAAADAEYDWAWYGELVGGYFQSHPAIQPATVKVADRVHPATAGLPERWARTDEWYNYRANPRGDVHVLATLDESTYTGGNMGFDHPIAWCHEYAGGRAFYTGMGHTAGSYAEPLFRQHLLGGIRYAAGAAPAADDGATVDANYRKVVLDANTVNPMTLDIAPDGRVFWVEIDGAVMAWSPVTSTSTRLGTIPCNKDNEDGLLGIALDPNFASNNWIYLFYSAPEPAEQHVSRFTLGANNRLDMASERVLLRIPVERRPTNHSAGSLDFGPDGLLYIALGDNTNPFASNGYAPIDEQPGRDPWDAQKSSSNTNDLRGKILRIRPQPDGTYTIPPGNLFPAGDPLRRPEIYTMGHRNPFRISVDPETNWLYAGDVGPDAQNDSATRGPRGYDEINQVRTPGNYGWPYFNSNNKPYVDYDFATATSAAPFDPAAPFNDSPNNTGARNLPPARSAWIWYPYGTSATFPEVGTGGRTAMAGPVYHYNPGPGRSPNALPAYFDDTLFIYEWSRKWIKEVKVDSSGNVLKINPFASDLTFARPMDMKFGPDGMMYVLEWGTAFGGGNADAQLVRVEYVRDARPPAAAASADRDSGPAPLAVQFSSADTDPGARGPVTYAWDFDGDNTTDSTAANPAFTYTAAGNYTARLTVTDTTGATSSSTVPVTVGNTRPVVSLIAPPDGSFFTWGQYIPYHASVTDAEDGSTAAGTVAGSALTVQAYVGHNDHAHPSLEYPGPSGVVPVDAGHGDDAANVFMLLEARYTDRGGAGGSQPLTGRTLVTLQPRRKQAEHYSASGGVLLVDSGDAAGGATAATGLEDNDWISFRPVHLQNIDSLRYRLAAAAGGATIEVRADSPTGTLLSTANVNSTGGAYATVPTPVTNPGGTHELFFVFRGTTAALNGLKLNWVEFDRANNTAPTASNDSYTLPAGAPFDVPRASGVLADDADGQQDVLFAGVTAAPANGTLVLNPDGSFRYTPHDGFGGVDTFTYFAHDGVSASAPATVSLRVTAVPPTVAAVYVAGSDWSTGFKSHLADRGLGSAGYGFAVAGGAAQLDELPWANLDRVSIAFSGFVQLDAADLAVRGVNTAGFPLAEAGGFVYHPETRTATWTFARPLDNDRLLLDLNADAGGVSGAGGLRLDGNWSNGADAFPSGNGTAGGDFRFQLNVLPGDANRSGAVNSADVTQTRGRQLTSTGSPGTPPRAYSVFHDANGNGAIGGGDVLAARTRQGTRLPTGTPASAAPVTAADVEPGGTGRSAVTRAMFVPGPVLLDLPGTGRTRRTSDRT